MATVILPANLDADRELLIDVLYRFLSPLSNGRRFDWLYRENPHGSARVWIAVEQQTGQVVGASAAFPRRLYVGGTVERGCVLGDFCIHPHYRSLGPALQLQRACLGDFASGLLTLGYDFPSANMMAVYKRLGIEPRGKMVRMVKLLRTDRKISEKVKARRLAHGLSAVSNRVLEWKDRRFQRKKGWTISTQEATCGQEFSALAQEVCDRYGVCVQRSAEFLNWRYLANPLRPHQILTARRNGALAGYLFFTQEREDAEIVDLFGLENVEILASLVTRATEILRDRGVMTLSAPLLASHRWVALFESLGFYKRESCPVVIHPPTHPATLRSVAESCNWFLMDGDRDS